MKFRQTIFLTGFPGFIAARLVARLARNDTQFFLLVQPDFIEKAMNEIERIAAEYDIPLENFALVEGDITLENLGINEKDLAVVQAETTDVYHLAAIYDLGVEKNLAFRVNV
jgi:thioester reductase-like protein